MNKLLISKNEEVKTVTRIWNMGAESLPPDDYAAFEGILKRLCDTRKIDNEQVQYHQTALSGKRQHNSDCETSNAPAYLPGPCDCDYFESEPGPEIDDE